MITEPGTYDVRTCCLYHLCVCAERATRAQLRPLSWERCNVLLIHVFHSASRGSSVHARLTRAVRSGEFSVLVTAFTCFFIFPFLGALVVPLFLNFHLNLGCYVPSGVERSYNYAVTFLFVSFAITLRCNTTACIIACIIGCTLKAV